MVSAFEPVRKPNAVIRIATPADARFVAAIENDLELKRLIGGVSGRSEEDYRRFLATQRDFRLIIVESAPAAIPIAICGLLTGPLAEHCEVRVILKKDYWGHGIGTDVVTALSELAAEKYPGRMLTAKIHPENIGSLAVARKVGFVEAGVIASGPYDGWIEFTSSTVTPPTI